MKFQMSGGSLARTKNILHFLQGFCIFLAWALTIAIWTKGGSGIDGRTGWYWGLVSFFSLFDVIPSANKKHF